MPPKQFFKFKQKKRMSDALQDSEKEIKPQITISKFFSPVGTKYDNNSPSCSINNGSISKQSGDATDIIVIDDSEDQGKIINEKMVSSPLKKRQKLNDDESDLLKPKKQENDVEIQNIQNSVTQGPPHVSLKCKQKLQTFAALEDDKLVKPLEFDFSILKREKASALSTCDAIDISDKDKNGTISYKQALCDQKPSSSNQKKFCDALSVSNSTQACKNAAAKLDQFSSTSASTSATTDKQSKFTSDRSKGKSKVKYTQLEQQFVEIKEKYQDTLLFVECGYKYRFFGEDAEIAADVLKIYCHVDHNFMTASIPTHRLFVHVRRLVAAGYKVGVVSQMETAAIKAAGSNRNTPFVRQLSALYTKSTLIGEDIEVQSGEGDSSHGDTVSMETNYLMCISDGMKDTTSKSHHVGIVAVQLSTGTVIYDSFDEKPGGSELETRLTHIQPVEVLLSHNASPTTEKAVDSMSYGSSSCVRVEKCEPGLMDYSTAFNNVSLFFKQDQTKGNVLQEVINLPNAVICCLSALIDYLTQFKLDGVLQQVSNFRQFTSQSSYMQLNSRTVRNLEMFHNSTDGTEKGSLYSTLNKTCTRPGARLLRSWLSQPLLDKQDILERHSAISDLLKIDLDLSKLKTTLSRLPDLETALTAAYHKKCSTSAFYTMCTSLETLQQQFNLQHLTLGSQLTSSLLSNIFEQVPALLKDVNQFTSALFEQSAKDNTKTHLFTDESRFPAVVECKDKIQAVIQQIHEHRRYVRLTVHQQALTYTTVLSTEFLIEVKNSNLSFVPKDWIKVSSTKAVGRFHTPFIVEKYKEIQQLREQLQITSTQAWIQFLELFGSKYQDYRKAVQLVSTLDCLLSLATVAQQYDFCRPTLSDDVCIDVTGGWHPVIRELLSDKQQYVPNNTLLKGDGERVMIITGPNMGGKSSYIKQVAIMTLMNQIGSYVPAQSATLSIMDAICTRMGAADELFQGRSTFMVELQETSDIIFKVTSQSLVILDELGRGTSTHDGVAIAQATLDYFINQPKCITLFVTHYPILAEFEDLFPAVVGNYHMSYLLQDKGEPGTSTNEKITFLYEIVGGVASRSYGLGVATLAGIPDHIVDIATHKSYHMEQAVATRRNKMETFVKLFKENDTSYREIIDKWL